MNNSNLKELYNSIKPDTNEVNQMKNANDSISNIIKNNIDGDVKVAELRLGGSFKKDTIIKGRKEIDIVVVISPKNNKKLYFKDLASLSMNAIENALYLNYYDKLKEVKDGAKITRNYERNTLSLINSNGVKIDFLVKFKKDQLLEKTTEKVENFYLERDKNQLDFIKYATQEYPKFKNVVMLIKYFRDEEQLEQLKSYMIEIMLYYSLKKYLSGENYIDYMNAFLKGMNDFISKKIIEVDDQMYSKLKVKKTTIPNDEYRVIDVANRSNNVAMYVKKINSFKKFYEKYKNKFVENLDQDKTQNINKKVECSIVYNWRDEKTLNIRSEIPGINPYETDTFENATNNTFKTIINDFYRHLKRILKLTQTHNLGKTIIINCNKQMIDIYNNGKIGSYTLSKEEKNKFQQLKQRINNDGINIEFTPR